MNIIYADQPLQFQGPTIFLCGPTPRRDDVKSWRIDALKIFEELCFEGTVLVPERNDWNVQFDYIQQVEWEFEGLDQAQALVFWVPRNTQTLPGFTTNVEFGMYVRSGKIVYGRPEDCPHNHYLDYLYTKVTGLTPCNELKETLQQGIKMASRSM